MAKPESPSPGKTQQLTAPDQVPDGLAKSDWQSIRAAYEAGRHAFQPTATGWQARNPGQQWTTQFDRRGFLTQPRDGAWTWGLELQSFGLGKKQTPIGGTAAVQADGQRLSYQWNDTVKEWFVNDARGLEHGYTVTARPQAAVNDQTATLDFRLAVRGTLTPVITSDAQGVEFRATDGATVLTYAGLKVWDADGQILASRFVASEAPSTLRLLVDERGARYPITIDPIAQQAYLKPDQTGSGAVDDLFGFSVAVAGDTVVVGAYQEDSSTTGVNSTPDEGAQFSGAAYVFVRSGATWTQQAYLKPAAVGTTQSGDYFGRSVAVSGDTVVVGAYQEDSSTTGVNSTPNEGASASGAAYVFVRSGATWSQQAYLKPAAIGTTQASDSFGISVAVAGDTVVVGAYKEDSSTKGVNSTPNEGSVDSGAAYVFVRSGTTWSQEAYLKPAAVGTTQAGDWFGTSVAVAGDTVVVGASGEDSSTLGVNSTPNEGVSNSGTAYVFVRSEAIWTQEAYLKPAAVGTTQTGDNFGCSVAIAGDTVVVGANGEDSSTTGVNSTPNQLAADSGAAYVFVRSETTWSQQAYLKPAAVDTTQDNFGCSVAMAGDTVVVGAYLEDSSTTDVNSTPNEGARFSGAAYVFVRSGTIWSQQAYLKPAAVGTTQAADYFGCSVAVSGDMVVVGAWGEDSSTSGVNSTPDEGASDSGAACVYVRSGTTWSQQAYLKPDQTGSGAVDDYFGYSVAVAGDTVVVGAYQEDSSTTGVNSTPNEGASASGAAYVFVRSGTTWSQQAYLKPAAVGTTQAGDNFGISVAVSGDTVVVGASLEDSLTTGVNSTPNEGPIGSDDSGAAYVFVRSGTTWSQQAYLKPAAVGTRQALDNFGCSVSVAGDTVVVGACGENSSTTGVNSTPNEGASASGAAYVFVRSEATWSQQAYLKPAAVGTTQAYDNFGCSVAVAGDTVVVGAYKEDSSTTGVNSTPIEGASASGAAYVFVRSGTNWSQQAYLKPAAGGTTQTGDNFGISVAVSGDTVVVGASGEDSSTKGVNITPNEGSVDSGAAYVFVRSGTTWTQEAYLKPAAVGTTQSGDYFGISVAVSGDTVVVGAYQEDSSTTGVNSTPDEGASASGAVYVFVRSGTTWGQEAYLKPAAVGNKQAVDFFGISVAVAGDTVVVGANIEDSSTTGVNSTPDEGASASGAAYIFYYFPAVTLEIRSPCGMGMPAVGSYTNALGTALTNSMANPEPAGGTQYVCTGWSMAGGDPASGATTQCVMMATNSAVLTWLWATNYYLTPVAGPEGSVTVGSGWQPMGVTTQLTAIAAPYYHFTSWSGGASGTSNPVGLLMDAPKSVTANFAANLTTTHPTPEAWLAQHGITSDFDQRSLGDADHDGLANWQEYVAGTDPTNTASRLVITAIAPALGTNYTETVVFRPATNIVIRGVTCSWEDHWATQRVYEVVGHSVTWPGVTGRVYSVEVSTNLLNWTALEGATDLPGRSPDNTFTDRLPSNVKFYRVKVRLP